MVCIIGGLSAIVSSLLSASKVVFDSASKQAGLSTSDRVCSFVCSWLRWQLACTRGLSSVFEIS